MSDSSTQSDIQTVTEQLALFGIDSLESSIYLHLTGKPPKSVLELSRELSLPRTSVYDCVTKLEEKGLVEKVINHKSQRIKAYPVSILQTYVDKEKARAELLQDKLATLEKSIAHAEPSPLATEVRYYHGARGLQQMIWNTLRTQDELVGYSQFGLVDIAGWRFAEKYGNELIRREIHNRVITSPQYIDRWRIKMESMAAYRRSLQQCRVVLPEQLYVSGDITIYNNVFAAAYWQHGEVVGVEIENPEIVKAQKSLFNLAWQHGQQVEWEDGSQRT